MAIRIINNNINIVNLGISKVKMFFLEVNSTEVSTRVENYEAPPVHMNACNTKLKDLSQLLFNINSSRFAHPHQPPLGCGGLGLRLFQSSNWEGLPFPLPPSLECGSGGSRVGIGSFLGARFEPPFFHHLGPPKIVITSYFGSKAIPF